MNQHQCVPRSGALALAAVLALLVLGAAPVAAQRPDTTRYVVVINNRAAGFYLEWRSGDALRSVYEYNDRGRGPHQEASLRLGPGGLPAELSIVGHGYLKDTVEERLTSQGGAITWESRLERGNSTAEAFYVPGAETPFALRPLVTAALRRGGRVPLLPSGEATVERGGDLTITVAGRPLHVVEYDIGGLGFSPFPVWLDDDSTHCATVSGWASVVPAGWEAAIPAMVAAQETARAARFARLARTLTHRSEGPIVIQHAGLFVAESALVRPGMSAVIVGDRVTAVGPDGSIPVPANAQVIDATGKTLLPGLWDMHVHVGPGDDGILFIAAGVTSARDMGNDTVTTLDLRRRFAGDSLIGPRLVLAGLIDSPGPFQVPIGLLADDSAAAARAVRWYAEHGYEQIKIYSSMKPDLVPGIIADAHARHLRVSGHVPAFMRAEEVVRLGFDEVQHANMLLLNFMDSVRDTRSMGRFTAVAAHAAELDFSSPAVGEFVSLFRTRGVDIDPTLVAFEDMFTARPGQLGPSEVPIADRLPPQVRRSFYAGGLPVPAGMDQRYRDSWAAMLRMVRTMFDAGVPVVAGTDAFPAGFTLFRELELYVQAGIPAPRVLQGATIGAARVMRHDDVLGSIAPGKLADLVLVDGDPTARISDIRRTSLVIKNGLIYRPEELYAAVGVRPAAPAAAQRTDSAGRPAITRQTLQAVLDLIGITYSDSDLDLLLRPRGQFGNDFTGRGDRRVAFDSIRAVDLPNAVPPALFFQPMPPAVPVANRAPRFAPAPRGIKRPANLEDAAYWPIADLAALLRTRQVTSVELTQLYLGRLRRFDPVLHAVVTLTDSLALEQARRADREIAAGRYRGVLHGIPFGVKDLYAVPGYPTTWGAEPYQRQVLDQTATTVRKLEDAGAVLVAKLSTGALAMGDVWFRDTTRNPWNPKQGSSGSSAGPAAAVSAGLVPFALGTETLGSIVSPSTRVGVTGLRPSFGRVSRAGVMALAWSMDKAGPLCRSAADCAIVFNVIRGRDAADPTTVDQPFPYDAGAKLAGLRIGYVKSAFDQNHRGAEADREVLEVLRRLGADLVPIELPGRPVGALRIILNAEAAASFDSLTRSSGIRALRDQGPGAWPNTFRSARFIPAVEYLAANRVRRLLQQDMDTLLRRVDAYVSPAFAGSNLLITNLTGHPCVAVPDGFMPDSTPVSITFCAPMYGEAAALEVARAYQDATPWDKRHPAAFVAQAP